MKLLLRILLLTKFARYRTIIGGLSLVGVTGIQQILCSADLQALFPFLTQMCGGATPLVPYLQMASGYVLGIGVVDKGAALGKVLKVAHGPNLPSPYFPQDQFRPGA
jgi:hypothetical protein